MSDYLLPLIVLAAWFIVIRYVLPRFGVST